MPRRLESGRAVVLKTRKRRQPTRQTSLGSNAAAAHGYSPRPAGRTVTVRRAPVRPASAPQSLRTQFKRDVAEEGQRGSPAARGAGFRRRSQANAQAIKIRETEKRINAKFDPRTGNYVRKVRKRFLPDQKAVIDPRTGKTTRDIRAAQRQGTAEWASAGSTAVALKILDQTLRPARAAAGGTRAALRGESVSAAVAKGLVKNKGPLFGKVLEEDLGVSHGLAQGLGFIADTAVDPATYVTGGAGSVARKAAADAARQASKRAARAGMNVEGQRLVASAAARKAEAIARQGKGVVVKVAGKEVPGVRRATERAGAGVARVTPGRVKRGGRGVLRQVNPRLAREGVDQATHQTVRQAEARSRSARSNLGTRAIDEARDLQRRIPEKDYARVIDAVERGKIKSLPEELRDPAIKLRSQMRYASRERRRAGVPEGVIGRERPVRVPAVTADVQGAQRAVRLASTARRRATSGQLAQYERAGQARGRAELIVARSGPVKRGEIAASAATKPVRTLRRLERERAGTMVSDVALRRAFLEERAAKQALTETKAAARAQRRTRGRALKAKARQEGMARGYFPHMREEDLLPPAERAGARGKARMGSVGTLKPATSRRRMEKRPIAAQNPARVAEGKSPLSTNLPLVRANYGAQTAGAVAKGRLIQDLRDAGRPVKKGVTFDRDREAVYHFAPGQNPRKLDVHKKDDAAEYNRALRGKGRAGQYRVLNEQAVEDSVRRIAQTRTEAGAFFDKVQGGWKLLATGTPGFQVRNAIGDTSMAFFKQGHRLPANMVQGFRATRRVSQLERAQQKGIRLPRTTKTIKVAGERMNLDDFVKLALREGAARGGQRGHEISSFTKGEGRVEAIKRVKSGALRRAGQPLGRALKNREDLTRLATFKWALDQGLKPGEAAQAMFAVHIDYGDVTDTERTVLRRAAPFYTFSARALPYHVKVVMQHPGRVAGIEKARQELGDALGVKDEDLPEYKQRAIPFAGPGGRALDAALPINLLNEVPNPGNLKGYPAEAFQFVGSQLTPFVKNPIELGLNKSFFFRKEIQSDDYPLVSAPGWVKRLPEPVKRDMGVRKIIDKRSGKTVLGWPGRVDYLAKSVPGMPVLLQQLTTEGSLRSGRQGIDKYLSATGVKVDPVDPLSNRLYVLLKRSHDIQVKINAQRQTPGGAGGKKSQSADTRRLYAEQGRVDEEIFKLSSKRGDVNPYKGGSLSKRAKARALGKKGVGAGGIPSEELKGALGSVQTDTIPTDELKRALGR